MENYEKEIKDLHQFFEDYALGISQRTDVTRFANVLDDQFVIVASSGNIATRIQSIDIIKSGYGQRDSFKIWIENVVLRQHIHDIFIVTYEEWQTIDDVTTKRMSTVIFQEDESKPNELIWLHVHESGLQEVAE